MKFFTSQNQWSHYQDTELLIMYKTQKNLEILAVLYGRYMHLVYGVCLKYLKQEDESQDAVMQIFEELSQKLLHHEVTNFKSWLHVLTRNYCLMRLRKTQKQDIVRIEEQSVEMVEEIHHTDWNIKEQYLSQMEKCMEQLKTEQQQCIRMFYLEEKCYKEIEQSTGMNPMQVKSNIQNGKRNLKLCMEKNKYDES